jgi:multicomponent Na+:H+ antiporter subunit E
MTGRSLAAVLPALGMRLVLFGGLWLVLTEGDLRSPYLAAVSVVAAAVASLLLARPGLPPERPAWRPGAVLRFLGFFVRESLHGGIDVARRSLDPRLPISPGYIEHRVRLPGGPAQAALCGTISLLPGTLSTRLEDGRIRIHVLDRSLPTATTIERLEDHLGAVFGIVVGPGSTEAPAPPGG